MKPREIIAETTTSNGAPLILVHHDNRFFLESEGRQLDANHLGYATEQLVTMLCRPFRPARQPRLVFLGLGLGHALQAARAALPQEKASFVILPESPELPGWITKHLDHAILDDERIQIEGHSPFQPLTPDFEGTQGIVGDLDLLESLAPPNWSVSSPSTLLNLNQQLKNGGLLGLLSTRPVPGLEKEMRKAGFEVAVDIVSYSERSKKNRTLYLARKGRYQTGR